MTFTIKNFGKIESAEVELDGITIICGNNNTGKSTVGKALYAFYNSMRDYRDGILNEKRRKLMNVLRREASTGSVFRFHNLAYDLLADPAHTVTADELKNALEKLGISITAENTSALLDSLNTPESKLRDEYVFRRFNSIMNGQVKNSLAANHSKCYVSARWKDGQNTISFQKNSCLCQEKIPVEHRAIYINSPFVLDALNRDYFARSTQNDMERSAVNAIEEAQEALSRDSASNLIESVMNKEALEKVKAILKKAYSGETVIDHGVYYYHEGSLTVDFRNISAGLKAFALIERLLETGALQPKDVLILDEPEIHLHSEWQLIYAELIVILQKVFNLTILVVTHSFLFAEALGFFMQKYETYAHGRFYLPEKTKCGFSISAPKELRDLKRNLSTGSMTLGDLEYAYEMEQEDDGE